jgi:membrane associated rhomboid family serine protease
MASFDVDVLQAALQQVPTDTSSRHTVWEWSLVLMARGIDHSVERSRDGWGLYVRQQDARQALEEIQLYEEENLRDQETDEDAAEVHGRLEPNIWILLFIAAFHKLTTLRVSGFGFDSIPWAELGSVSVWEVWHGELWRLATGLTLHSGAPHLVGNLVVGGFFIVVLSRELGSGYAWFFVLLSGILGNGINCVLQSYAHVSIGASTAVFGCVGILGGMRIVYREGAFRGRKLVPFAAGLGLLALLGTGGKNTDLGAHLFGFAAGLVLGLAIALARRRDLLPRRGGNTLCGWLSLAVVASAWLAALSAQSA